MIDGQHPRPRQAVGIIVGQVMGGEMVTVKLAGVLVLVEDPQIVAEVLGDLAVVVFQPAHVLHGLPFALGDQLLGAGVVEAQERPHRGQAADRDGDGQKAQRERELAIDNFAEDQTPDAHLTTVPCRGR